MGGGYRVQFRTFWFLLVRSDAHVDCVGHHFCLQTDKNKPALLMRQLGHNSKLNDAYFISCYTVCDNKLRASDCLHYYKNKSELSN